MADPIVLQAEPVPEETAQKIQAAMGAANEANLTAMLAMRAELEAQTMRGEDGRLHGPLQPCTIINFNPCWLRIGGGMKVIVPPYDWQGKEGNSKKPFLRGGREHVGHVLTVASAEMWLSPGGHTEHIDVGWAQPTLSPRYMSPNMICWHIWRDYMTDGGSAQMMGGVMIFDGDIHELDRNRLEKSKNTVLVPEGYPIKNGKGRYAIRYNRRDYNDVLNELIEYQKNYLNRIAQTAFELFNSKEEEKRRGITEPMRRWGRFGVEMGYFKDTAPWMMEMPNASATADAQKTCPVCRETTVQPDILLCPSCRAPFNADCTVAAVKHGYPVAESFIDALDDTHYKEVMEHLKKQAERRKERGKLAAAEK
jgi:hypothetical protein